MKTEAEEFLCCGVSSVSLLLLMPLPGGRCAAGAEGTGGAHAVSDLDWCLIAHLAL